MSCLYCLTARQRGGVWVCNRCGNLMFVRPAPARGVGFPDDDEQTPGAGEWPPPHALQRRPIVYRRDTAPQAGSSAQVSDASDAVVLDLDAARRVRAGRTS